MNRFALAALALLLALPAKAQLTFGSGGPSGGSSVFVDGQAIQGGSFIFGPGRSTSTFVVDDWLLVKGASVNVLGSLQVGATSTFGGNIGLGASPGTSPDFPIDFGPNAATRKSIALYSNGSGGAFYGIGFHANGYLEFWRNDALAMSIGATLVGIGTDAGVAPTAALQVNRTGGDIATFTNSADTIMAVHAGSSMTVKGFAVATSGIKAPHLTAVGGSYAGSSSYFSVPDTVNAEINSGSGGGVTIYDQASPRMNSTATGVVFNNNAVGTVDFRVKCDVDEYCIFVDASAENVGIGTSAPASKLHLSGGSVLVSSGALRTEGAIARPLELGARMSDGTFSTFTVTSDGVMFLNVLNSASALPTVPGLWVRDLNGVGTPVIGFHQASNYRRGMRNPGGNRDLDLFTQNDDGDGKINIYTGNNTLAARFIANGLFEPVQKTTLEISLMVPTRSGQIVDNSTIGKVCRSTGTNAGNFGLITDPTTGCF